MKTGKKGRCLRMCLKERKTYWDKIRETKVQNEFHQQGTEKPQEKEIRNKTKKKERYITNIGLGKD